MMLINLWLVLVPGAQSRQPSGVGRRKREHTSRPLFASWPLRIEPGMG
jgi:hypothetical protein